LVISGRANTVVARIPVSIIPGGVAVNPRINKIYAVGSPLGVPGSFLLVISGRTNHVLATAPAGGLPFDTAVNPRTRVIYVTNDDGNTVVFTCRRG